MNHSNARKVKGRVLAGLSIVALGFGMTGCASSDTATASGESGEEVTVRVVTAVDNAYFFAPVQYHEFLGTWEDAGINVEFVAGTTPTLGQILASGEADIALGGGTTEAALRDQGIEQTIVGSNFSPWAMYVVANNNTDATTIEELKGANFGITGAGAPSDFSVHKIAEDLGWNEGDYSTTAFGDVGSMVAGFRSGAVDAIIWMSDTAISLEEEGSGRILGDSSDYVGPTVLESFSVMDKFAAENPEAVRVFFEKYYEMVEKLQAEPELFESVLVEEGKYSPEVAKRLAELELPRMSADGRISDEELDGLSEGAAFSTGDRTNENPLAIEYTYWQDLLK
ncbi:ABC-type nitrate/sulfonate/bicarbonate transport system, substrate-binding protein [Mycetocola miduiensis]|uniref:ABC-type nitrate/sulfonate/bicarbonate transport system, substrate-binding protein n=1 Tax=Mycetocola miduiensis TaxID=995034 RepID=A0A1I4Z050_9MICO|nr:ABC-type nitrate/sulfonate/bicarbonate transport system, substrate-binding protein [Mycetocola miduiensis]